MKLDYNDWENTLKNLDEKLSAREQKVTLVIVGGGAFLLTRVIDRATEDLDVLNSVGEWFYKMMYWLEIDINDRVRVFEDFYLGWEEDIVDIENNFNLKNITLKTLSVERLLAAKCFTRKNDIDIDLFCKTDVKIDFKKFEKCVVEIFTFSNNFRKNSIFDRVEEIKKYIKERGLNMRILTFKGYLQNKIRRYVEGYYKGHKITFTFLYNNSDEDIRLATLAQAYYLSINNVRLANKFSVFTQYTYLTLDDYLKSDDKYATEYAWYFKNASESKEYYRNQILKLKMDRVISNYAISKNLNIPQINLSNFLNKKIDGALSIEKVVQVWEYLESVR